jgi:hypothetical protein
LALLPFQFLFTQSSHRYQLLAHPPFPSALLVTLSLCCVLVFSFLFIVQFFFYCRGISLPRGLC